MNNKLHGMGKKGFFCLIDLSFEFDFDFNGLQETMKKKIGNSVWRKFDENNAYNWLWSPSMGPSRGILCGIKSSRFDVLALIWDIFY
jgi:hypothetical protein